MLGSLTLNLPTLLFLPPIYLLLNVVSNLYKNYLIARTFDLPILFAPFDPYGVPWQIFVFLFDPLLRHFRWARLLTGTWTWEDANEPATTWGLGETFAVVGPNNISLFTSDKAALEHILSRRKEFLKTDAYANLNIYGRNVDTVNGSEWELHRKLTAPCFNERVSREVWEESKRQAQSMVKKWVGARSGLVKTSAEDTRVIALHVLDAAGFGVKHDFFGGVRDPAPGHILSHRDALNTVLNSIATSIFCAQNKKILEKLNWVCSKRLNEIVLAVEELGRYIDEAVEQDRKAGATKTNLISTLIRTVDRNRVEMGAKIEGAVSSMLRFGDQEIKGNIFIFNLAGHDTTANALAYAFGLLACYPEIQDWAVEEIDAVVGAEGNGDMVYEEIFPKLNRMKAVMYETLRLYGAIPRMPRIVTATSHTIIPLSNPERTITVPANTDITLRLHAMHTSVSNFPEPFAFRPNRWITSSPDATNGQFNPRDVTSGFAAWSYGPRICPGKQFSMVEFVGVLSIVLKEVRVRPSVSIPGGDEVDFETARKRVLGLMKDSDANGPALRMNRPEEVCLKVEKRLR